MTAFTDAAFGQHLVRLRGRLADRYEFLSLLGKGGFGAVFEVRNIPLKRTEALKVLREDLEDEFSIRFAQEAQVSASLEHPHIVKIFDFGETEGVCWYSMQFVKGPSLGGILEVQRSLDQLTMVRMAIPVLEALGYSHEQGVVHRDIKPANIMLSPKGHPFLTDFGIAKLADSTLKTQTGTMLGTPAYIAPEQAMGETVDGQADLYSLGIMLYEVMTGRLPFLAETSMKSILMRLTEDPEPILQRCPDMDPNLAAVIMRSLARDKAQRWATAGEMKEALVRACELAGMDWDRAISGLPILQITTKPLPPMEPVPPLVTASPADHSQVATAALPGRITAVPQAVEADQATAAVPEATTAIRQAAAENPALVATAALAAGSTELRQAAVAIQDATKILPAFQAPIDLISTPPEAFPAEPVAKRNPLLFAAGVAVGVMAIVIGGLSWVLLKRDASKAPAPPLPLVTASPTSKTEPAGPAAQPIERTPAPAPPKQQVAAVPKPKPEPAPAAPPLVRRAVTKPLLDDSFPSPVVRGLPEWKGRRLRMAVTVGEDGRVTECKVLDATEPECAKAAREAAMQYRFTPAKDYQGNPIKDQTTIFINF